MYSCICTVQKHIQTCYNIILTKTWTRIISIIRPHCVLLCWAPPLGSAPCSSCIYWLDGNIAGEATAAAFRLEITDHIVGVLLKCIDEYSFIHLITNWLTCLFKYASVVSLTKSFYNTNWLACSFKCASSASLTKSLIEVWKWIFTKYQSFTNWLACLFK